MSDDLHEILERINWTRDEIKTLADESKAWRKRSFTIYARNDAEPGFFNLYVNCSEQLPLSIRARSGTIANEIRSSLDGLASTLAKRKNPECRDAYFPLAHQERDFRDDKRLKKRLSKFRPVDRDTLLDFRPFAIGDDGKPGNLLLFGLHHADIKRKHHRLVTKSTEASIGILPGVMGQIYIDTPTLTVGESKIAKVSNDTTNGFAFTALVAYAEPDALRGRELVPTLNEFADVAERIVRAFL